MCGEQICEDGLTDAVYGSPPRVRGTVSHDLAFFFGPGITPACAGNSLFAISS